MGHDVIVLVGMAKVGVSVGGGRRVNLHVGDGI